MFGGLFNYVLSDVWLIGLVEMVVRYWFYFV